MISSVSKPTTSPVCSSRTVVEVVEVVGVAAVEVVEVVGAAVVEVDTGAVVGTEGGEVAGEVTATVEEQPARVTRKAARKGRLMVPPEMLSRLLRPCGRSRPPTETYLLEFL